MRMVLPILGGCSHAIVFAKNQDRSNRCANDAIPPVACCLGCFCCFVLCSVLCGRWRRGFGCCFRVFSTRRWMRVFAGVSVVFVGVGVAWGRGLV